jgi:DNA repair exonuclease SbcCD ATPase subunit
MDEAMAELNLKRPVTIKVVVTPRWKEDVQQQLQNQINQLDSQLQQLEMQSQRAISEIQRQNTDPNNPDLVKQVAQQVENVQAQVTQKKSELLDKKNQILQQLQQIQQLEMEQEVNQGQVESVFTAKKGDNLVQKMQVEILLRDGIIEDIRGTI